MTALEIIAALAILVGIVGIIVPLLPGVLLIAVALVVWAAEKSTPTAWWVLGIALAVLVIGQVVKYLVPGRRLKATVPTRTLVIGAIGAVAGFFLIPVVGLLIGFPAGVYVAERARVGGGAARESTLLVLRAVGLSILIELASAATAVAVWLAGVVVTAP